MSTSIFVKVNDKTFILRTEKNTRVSLYEICLNGWDRYFEYLRATDNDFNLDVSGNPFKLIGKLNFLRYHRLLIGTKLYNHHELSTEINLDDYKERTFVISSYLCSEEKKFTREDVKAIMEIDFSRFDN